MTRKKKTRKTGPLAPSKAPKANLQRAASEQTKHKGKGKKPGSRFNVASQAASQGASQSTASNDPRHGSKKPIQLVSSKPAPLEAEAATATFDRKAAERELQQLENDHRLQGLLEAMEEGEELTRDDLAYVDTCTARFEQLAEQLGIDLEDDEIWEDEEDD
ncbi:hypothetical protein CWI80_06565 [Pseudidiomarina sediminum]|uniref:Der GTPase-activating protein YihI n=1 Tax=Pseudidiomarina sediminum TaxID=431675 RepID=A0A432ZAL6_9GAMM|nr:Der GTPase-activating protein YihI [Pseudidiomarina sediminum]MBY6064198.1 GTPase-activating protein [Pseudidiomarina sediminum]RUO74985.1 hypothetical protein CWI80_06565 [Pseudidiomarina sediminum]